MLNKGEIMSDYLIRYATESDIPAIKKFIDSNWKKNHILAREDGLFEWQYTSDKLDYILGVDDNGNIQGMLGFISYSDDDNRDIATSMWKANPGTGFLGIKLLMFILKNEQHRTLFSPGINMRTSGGIYKRMGIATGKMNQWYRLRRMDDYKIAKVIDDNIPEYTLNQLENIVQYSDYNSFQSDFNHQKYVSKDIVPYKSMEYIKRRYFSHPSYDYLIYGIKDDEETKAVIVMRIQECNGAKVIRFVDCIGDCNLIGTATAFIDHLLDEKEAEYIDMYENGVSEEILTCAGWTNLANTENVIPNYFSPYEQCNVDVNFCTTDENIILFRGDGDQDRPN